MKNLMTKALKVLGLICLGIFCSCSIKLGKKLEFQWLLQVPTEQKLPTIEYIKNSEKHQLNPRILKDSLWMLKLPIRIRDKKYLQQQSKMDLLEQELVEDSSIWIVTHQNQMLYGIITSTAGNTLNYGKETF